MTLTLAEGVMRSELPLRAITALCTMAMLIVLPWRRVYPLLVVLVAFGLNTLVQNAARLLDVPWTNFSSTIFLMILPYSLFCWASGREAFLGLGYIYLTYGLTIGLSDTPFSELLAGILFLLFGAALGLAARYRDAADRRAKQQVQQQQREQLARELHDTVAHHVSAIAIQAQAGRAAVDARPEAPLEALALIEDAASRTLTEMRRIVRSMRTDGPLEFAPAVSLKDIERLAQDNNATLNIAVTLAGDLDDLDSSMIATLFRLTQESITNAVRHARDAENLSVLIRGDAAQVSLLIEDDGRPVGRPGLPGLGLQGMAERTALLGGSMSAGPAGDCGWRVEANLPKTAAPS